MLSPLAGAVFSGERVHDRESAIFSDILVSSTVDMGLVVFTKFGSFHTGTHTAYVAAYTLGGEFLLASPTVQFEVLPAVDAVDVRLADAWVAALPPQPPPRVSWEGKSRMLL